MPLSLPDTVHLKFRNAGLEHYSFYTLKVEWVFGDYEF